MTLRRPRPEETYVWDVTVRPVRSVESTTFTVVAKDIVEAAQIGENVWYAKNPSIEILVTKITMYARVA